MDPPRSQERVEIMNTQIVEILSQVLQVNPETITPESSPDSIPAWDSLRHFELIAALESRFGVKFSIREIQSMDTGFRIERTLKQRGVVGENATPG